MWRVHQANPPRPNEYGQLVEAYRDAAGRPTQRTVASLGRLDQINTERNSVISGLLRVTGHAPVVLPVSPPVAPTVIFGAPEFDS